MKVDIPQFIRDNLTDDQRYANLHRELILPTKTTLLAAGDIARSFYYIKQGCLRLGFNQDGKDITLQFFFDGQGVASIESFLRNRPSLFSIETIGPVTVWKYDKRDITKLLDEHPGLKGMLSDLITDRLIDYTHLFLSRIKDTPRQRYENLLKECPEIIQRVPQHYIASYLGITSVSLSRIKNRK